MNDQHIVYRDTKLTGNNLGKCRLLALSMWRSAGIDHHGAISLNTYTRALIVTLWTSSFGAIAAALHIGGEANAHQLALGTLAGLLSAQILVADDLHSLSSAPA